MHQLDVCTCWRVENLGFLSFWFGVVFEMLSCDGEIEFLSTW